MGLNTVQTYIPWNFHEQDQGAYNFALGHNVTNFVTTAQSVGLLVLIRAGPYACGEWEFGGFPAWLLNPTLQGLVLRTYEPTFIKEVDKWFDKILPMLTPLLYSNGGPVIMVQVENEFGSYGDVSSNPASAIHGTPRSAGQYSF